MGDTGPGVLEVQQILADLGYTATSRDGNFDTSTLRAVIAFQSDSALPVDGVVAVNTWLALRKRAGHHEEPSETGSESEGARSRQEAPPAAESPQPLEEPEPYMPPMPPVQQASVREEDAPPETLPLAPPVFRVPTVPLIQWQAIHEEQAVFHESVPVLAPSSESEVPVEEPAPLGRGWTRVGA